MQHRQIVLRGALSHVQAARGCRGGHGCAFSAGSRACDAGYMEAVPATNLGNRNDGAVPRANRHLDLFHLRWQALQSSHDDGPGDLAAAASGKRSGHGTKAHRAAVRAQIQLHPLAQLDRQPMCRTVKALHSIRWHIQNCTFQANVCAVITTTGQGSACVT